MALQRVDDTDFLGVGSKRKKVIEVGNWSIWSELLDELLESIFKRVGVIEYLMCACVCKSWRKVANSFKQEFMASQGPLIFLLPQHASNHCYFYNMFDERLYRAALPHLAGNECSEFSNKCLGFTCGYLVLSGMKENRTNIWLVNPFTRHELEFRAPPIPFSNVILASLANSDQEFLVVAFCRVSPYLQIRRSRDVNWKAFKYDKKPWRLIDVAVFKGKIYVLSSYGEIWTLNLNSDPKLTKLEVTSVAASQYTLHLVASHEELYMAHCHPGSSIEIYKLDFERKKWEKVKQHGEVLFLGDMKCCGLSFPTPSWSRSCEHMNRVWYLIHDPEEEIIGYHRALYASERSKWQKLAMPEDWKSPKIFFRSPVWYFPHLSSTVDSVNEN